VRIPEPEVGLARSSGSACDEASSSRPGLRLHVRALAVAWLASRRRSGPVRPRSGTQWVHYEAMRHDRSLAAAEGVRRGAQLECGASVPPWLPW
jgi:hypothetical protein